MAAISRVDTATDRPARKRRLVKRFCHSWTVDGVEYWIEVPKGFAYRASSPILPRRYAFEDRACVHDALYLWESFHAGRLDHDGLKRQLLKMRLGRRTAEGTLEYTPMTRRVADAVLLGGPEPKWMRYAAYAYARTFGWWMWHDVPQQIARFFRTFTPWR